MPSHSNIPGVRSIWWINEVSGKITLTMVKRVKIATDFLKQRVVHNISRPVTKLGKGRVTDRSKSGEFPKADTTQLMKGIMGKVQKVPGGWEGYVGTPHHYGVILETRMDRSFLLRTFNENYKLVMKILTGPIL